MRTSFLPVVCAVLAAPALLRAQAPPPAAAPPAASPAASTHKPVLPRPPAELLALLPKAPDQWQLKQSQANNFVMDWASAQAWREFTYTPPPTAGSGGPPPAPFDLRITITDTGYYQGLIGDFEGTPSSKPGAVGAQTLGGFPARRLPLGTTGERLRVLVNNRYIVQIDAQNQPPNSVQRWLQLIDLAKIAALPLDGEEILPRPYTVVKIDEVNPKNSSVSKVTFATQEEADKTARRRR